MQVRPRALLVWLAACTAADDVHRPDPPGRADETDPSEPVHTDAVPPETDRPPRDSEPGRDTDGDGDGDTEPTVPLPPFSGGYVELAGARWAEQPFAVHPGDHVTGEPPQRTTAWMGDLDGDGVAEVVTGTTMYGAIGAPRHVRVLRWTAAGLVEDPALSEALGSTRHPPLAAVDLDRDGLLDLVSGDIAEAVRWGTAPGAWGPPVDLLDSPGDATIGYAVGLYDVDGDGWLDLMFGDAASCRRIGWVALRTGPRDFVVEEGMLGGPLANTIAFVAGPAGDGSTFVYAVDDTHCYDQDKLPHAFRQVGWRDDRVPVFEAFEPAPPDAYWKSLPAYVGRAMDGLSPMGAGLDDLDGDGFLDLVVTVGMPAQVILAGQADGSFRDVSGGVVVPDALGWLKFRWGVAFPDVDLDGIGDVVWSVGDDEGSFLAHRGEPMANAVTWNAGGFDFVDVSQQLGVTHTGSWRALSLGDPDHDGDADLAFGGHGNPPIVYRNDVDVAGRRGVSLRLVGSTSNVLGVGALVDLVLDGQVVRTALVGASGNPLGWGEPLVFLGAGDRERIDAVVIRWPSGLVQELRDLPVGQLHTVVEPPTVEVLDADRAAPADGFSQVVVRLVPRDREGRPDPSVKVKVSVNGAPATVVFPPSPDGQGTWLMQLRAPSQSGTSWLTVRFDDVALPIAPKIRWTR